MQEKWTKEFRDKMDSYGESVPENLWPDIMAAVERGRRRRTAVWVFGMGAAAAIAAIAYLGFGRLTIQDKKETVSVVNNREQEYFTQNTVENILPSETETIAGHGSEKALPAEITGSSTESGTDNRTDNRTDTGNGHPAEHGNDRLEILSGNFSSDDTAAPGTDSRTETGTENRNENLTDAVTDNWTDTAAEKMKDKYREKRRISLSFSASGAGGSSNTQIGYNATNPARLAQTPMLYGASPVANIVMFNRTREVTTDTRHFLPVKFGVSAAFEINGRWALESGLYYSLLISKSTSGSDSYYYKDTQSLHYLGIPLNVRFNIWNNKDLGIYVSGGGMVEKCISGTLKSDYYYNGQMRETEKKNISVKPLQWSLGASAGLQYNISGIMGIYVEPGIIYHLENKSPVESSYTDKPLNFNLNIGLRFSL